MEEKGKCYKFALIVFQNGISVIIAEHLNQAITKTPALCRNYIMFNVSKKKITR